MIAEVEIETAETAEAAEAAEAAETAAAEITKPIVIQPVSVSAILDAPDSAQLIISYAEECLVADALPQRETYLSMERMGLMQCFGAFATPSTSSISSASSTSPAAPAAPALLIGFISVLSSVLLHNGKRMGVVESIFVDQPYRSTGAGDQLLLAAEQYAAESNFLSLTCLPRIGSAFDKMLSRRPGYTLTHHQHTRWMA
jgi:GNAT superfamily N-acetyltransferase